MATGKRARTSARKRSRTSARKRARPTARRRARDLERTYTRSQFVAKLRRLADAVEAAGPFTIQVASERLRIPADATFNIEHERAGGVDELEFQLRWSVPA
jgi:amphi-Trp domain-containing protein